MAYTSTLGDDGRVTIPAAVRNRLDIDAGDEVSFSFDDEHAVRLVPVPADPMDRLDAARERAAPLDLDARELIERERDRWDRV